jgi:hypothetical protein
MTAGVRIANRFALVLACFATTLLGAQTAATLGSADKVLASNAVPSYSQSLRRATLIENYGKLPLSFEANQGQTDARVKFLSRSSGYSLFLTDGEAVFTLRGKKEKEDDFDRKSGHSNPVPVQLSAKPKPEVESASAVLRMKLAGANHTAKVAGQDELPGRLIQNQTVSVSVSGRIAYAS